LIQASTKRPTRVAQQEVGAGLIAIEVLPPANSDENPKKKPAK
jgi:hypothetical protein